MKIEFPQHMLDEFMDVHREVLYSAARMKYGTWSERNPFAGKMVKCGYCGQRSRENAIVKCCNAKVVKSPEPVLDKSTSPVMAKITMRQQGAGQASRTGIMGKLTSRSSCVLDGLRRHPHRNAKSLRIALFTKMLAEGPTGSPAVDFSEMLRNHIVRTIDEAKVPFGLKMRAHKGSPIRFFSERMGRTSISHASAIAKEWVEFLMKKAARAKQRVQKESRRRNRKD